MTRLLRRFSPIVTAVFLAALFAAACGTGSERGDTGMKTDLEIQDIPDTRITRAVETELLFDETVSEHMIDVSTEEGVVTLDGTVDNILSKDRAATISESVKGVRAIVNLIEATPSSRPDDAIRDDVTGRLLDDPVTDAFEIDVSVQEGDVTLSGTVDSWQEKQFAAKIAKSVMGVREVENDLMFMQDIDRPDLEIVTEIERQLEIDAYIDDGLIEIDVDDGVVTLDGVVGSLAEKTRAFRKSWVAGVREVHNDELEVQHWARDELQRASKVVFTTNEEIRQAVEDALIHDPRVSSFDIGVSVENNGEVTLTGEVDNLRAREAAGKDAHNTVGVWDVNNDLAVRPVEAPVDEQIERNVQSALLMNPVVDRFDIDVEVRNRKAYLHGSVDTYYESKKAEKTAAEVFGVVSVGNYLSVDADWKPQADAKIEENIEDELLWSPFVDSEEVSIAVDDGTAILSGTVDTKRERDAAIDNAFDGGARSVISELAVSGNPKLYPNNYMYPPYEFPMF